ncbi:MAG TPA: hypothetical protein VFK06_14745 [Candidatus Angelobacter sp.]|nr:hypothetical protein [Candidatus Angelobacter sp.]
MSDDKAPKSIRTQLANEVARIIEHFGPDGPLGPIDDPVEWEKLRAALPPPQRDLNLALTQFVQLVEYCGQHNIKLGSDVADAMSAAAKLPIEERAVRIREISQDIMKRLSDARDHTSFRM